MKRKRRTHSAEFKARVALEALKGIRTINQIAQDEGIHPVQVNACGCVYTYSDNKPQMSDWDDKKVVAVERCKRIWHCISESLALW